MTWLVRIGLALMAAYLAPFALFFGGMQLHHTAYSSWSPDGRSRVAVVETACLMDCNVDVLLFRDGGWRWSTIYHRSDCAVRNASAA